MHKGGKKRANLLQSFFSLREKEEQEWETWKREGRGRERASEEDHIIYIHHRIKQAHRTGARNFMLGFRQAHTRPRPAGVYVVGEGCDRSLFCVLQHNGNGILVGSCVGRVVLAPQPQPQSSRWVSGYLFPYYLLGVIKGICLLSWIDDLLLWDSIVRRRNGSVCTTKMSPFRLSIWKYSKHVECSVSMQLFGTSCHSDINYHTNLLPHWTVPRCCGTSEHKRTSSWTYQTAAVVVDLSKTYTVIGLTVSNTFG